MDKINRGKAIFNERGLIELIKEVQSFVLSKIMTEKIKYYLSQTHYRVLQFKHNLPTSDPYELIYVDPENILFPEYEQIIKLRDMCYFFPYGSYIFSGEWDQLDLHQRRVTKKRWRLTYDAFEMRYKENKPWEETEFFKYCRKTPDSELNQMYRSDNLESRIDKLDRLYNALRNEGYKTQRELQNSSLLSSRRNFEIPDNMPPEIHEIGISIGRDGQLIWTYGGCHRLLLSKIIGINEVPVRVYVRHSNWQKVRSGIEIENDIQSSQQFTNSHPDLVD